MELQGEVEKLRKKGLGLAAISYDTEEILTDFSKLNGITYPLLADVGSKMIERYGILNTVALEALGPNADDPAVVENVKIFATVLSPSERYRGIPFPGTFIVDRQGTVTSRFFEDFYRERRTVSNIMLSLGAAGAAVRGAQVSTDHLEMKTYPSDPSVVVGNRFSLVLDVTPRPGMHVYAPGAQGYRVITFAMTPDPFVRVLPMQYPASEIYFFEPLNERVPVFQKPFTLLQEVVVEATPEAQEAFRGKDTLTIGGTLEYQACDDKICYNPVSLPLSWDVELKPLVGGRPRPTQ